jgi:hypothetical protein
MKLHNELNQIIGDSEKTIQVLDAVHWAIYRRHCYDLDYGNGGTQVEDILALFERGFDTIPDEYDPATGDVKESMQPNDYTAGGTA